MRSRPGTMARGPSILTTRWQPHRAVHQVRLWRARLCSCVLTHACAPHYRASLAHRLPLPTSPDEEEVAVCRGGVRRLCVDLRRCVVEHGGALGSESPVDKRLKALYMSCEKDTLSTGKLLSKMHRLGPNCSMQYSASGAIDAANSSEPMGLFGYASQNRCGACRGHRVHIDVGARGYGGDTTPPVASTWCLGWHMGRPASGRQRGSGFSSSRGQPWQKSANSGSCGSTAIPQGTNLPGQHPRPGTNWSLASCSLHSVRGVFSTSGWGSHVTEWRMPETGWGSPTATRPTPGPPVAQVQWRAHNGCWPPAGAVQPTGTGRGQPLDKFHFPHGRSSCGPSARTWSGPQ